MSQAAANFSDFDADVAIMSVLLTLVPYPDQLEEFEAQVAARGRDQDALWASERDAAMRLEVEHHEAAVEAVASGLASWIEDKPHPDDADAECVDISGFHDAPQESRDVA